MDWMIGLSVTGAVADVVDWRVAVADVVDF